MLFLGRLIKYYITILKSDDSFVIKYSKYNVL